MTDHKQHSNNPLVVAIATIAALVSIGAAIHSWNHESNSPNVQQNNTVVVVPNPGTSLPTSALSERDEKALKTKSSVDQVSGGYLQSRETGARDSFIAPINSTKLAWASYLSEVSASRAQYAVVVRDNTSPRLNNSLETLLVDHFRSVGKLATAAAFTSDFAASDGFDLAYDGHAANAIRGSSLSRHAAELILIKLTKSSRVARSVTGLISVDVQASFIIIASESASVIDRFEINVVGPGATEVDAGTIALERIVSALATKGY